MLISSDVNAGQIVSNRESTRFYDDIGCLASDWIQHQQDATAFVHTKDGWADARTVAFARPQAVSTPMGYGFVAVTTADDTAAAERYRPALTWDEVVGLATGR